MPLQRLKLTDQICDEIERRIRDGQLKPGERLRAERELATEFGVSRATVAKALAQLQSKGLLTTHHGGGSYVNESNSTTLENLFGSILLLTDAQIDHFLELRSMIETEICRLACRRISGPNLNALQRHLQVMRQSRNDLTQFVEHDLEFHLELARATHNPLFVRLCELIQGVMRSQMFRGTNYPGAVDHAIERHGEILQALKDGDYEGALAATTAHLEDAAKEVQGTRPFLPVPRASQ